MERRFLRQLTEGYLTDKNAYQLFNSSEIEKIHETVLRELNYICDYIYEVDLEAYNEVYEMSKIQQQQVFEHYLNMTFGKKEEEEGDPINEFVSGTIAFLTTAAQSLPHWQWILGLAAVSLKRKPIAKKTFQMLAGIAGISEKIGKFIEKKSRYTRFRYAVIQKNREECYKRCGVTNLSQINVRDYFNKFAGDKKDSRAKCLATCYIECEIRKVKLLTRMYFICLRQTANFDKVKNMNSVKLMTLLRDKSHRGASISLSSACGDYYDEISDGMAIIDDLIEFFFSDPSSRSEMRMAVQKDIDEVKHDVIKMHENEIRKFRLSI